MAEVTTFSSSGADAITRTIELEEEVQRVLSPEELEEAYDIARTVNEIEKGDYTRIALQFPDELLPHSVPIFRLLKLKIADTKELYILADTSYGSCCVDEVAAQHVEADALVHYGHACMSQTSRLPVIYVLGKKPIDPSHCAECFFDVVTAQSNVADRQTVLLRYDVGYAHRADSIVSELKSRLPSPARILHTPIPLVAHPSPSGQHRTPHELHEAGQDNSPEDSSVEEASPENSVILYIGGESLTLTNLLLTHASYEVYSYDPKTRTARLESGRTNKLLMRRYAVVQRARDADVIGILVGTLGVANYLPLISHLRDIIKRAHKKSYTLSVGKINPAKLGNFLEIECFVLVACPENSLLDAKEFLRPIVTPYELELALQPTQTWTGRYVLDFEQLLREQQDAIDNSPPENPEDEDDDQPVFSVVTGKYRHAKRYDGASAHDDIGDSSAVVLRNQENALSKMEDSAAAQFLQTRTFRGLETRVGQDAPSLLEQGRSGIARGYGDDHREDRNE
ncbi:diphthamide biosynthesis protein [Lentinus tigrinus ALCF2SS1-7]|uniref:2-(3-amino-3-carboxypropyl)histidine synthase subunit 2 n=1 Tax=Lentinus tigrinus ALCF2SS1-6 TaxID=1328759 RepID=A0A5C2SA31_9APHY|nr:diphthamide biosynthesis protein [Lentinus tigrinus ALCF2SS1-6]RPD73024.1 diphthamide biosynthesis protein [Lentinus tigrinus ALCF2SS1-7]